MPTPSLLIVPSRWKPGSPGKLYSQIPTNGNGDFNVTGVVTGAGNIGTRVNNLGYIEPITTSGTPRLDYYTSSGVPGCPALLVEPAATNLCLQSENFSAGYWSKNNIAFTSGAATAPDNTANAFLVYPTGFTNNAVVYNYEVVVSGTTYTTSAFVKASGKNWVFIRGVNDNQGVWFNLASGTLGTQQSSTTGSIQNYGNGWFRCAVTQTASSINGRVVILVVDGDSSTNVTASGTNGLLYWGAQLETGSVATSYIPTTTAAVTRNADVVSVSGAVSGSIGQTEGTIYLDTSKLMNATLERFFSIYSSTSPTFDNITISKTVGNTINFAIRKNNVLSTYTANFSGTVEKLACAFSTVSGGVAIYVNGTQLLIDTNSGSFASVLDEVYIGRLRPSVSTDNLYNGRIRAHALYTTRLSNADLMLLTMPGNNTYLPQAVWNNYLSRTGNSEVPDCLYTRHADLLDV